ncbi:hypothetical protein [Nocardia fluminea]|uniref:hypothetical protein n=1 Tax=Nocardia fluminea TaxID=134984 RepID=UPI003D09D557
MPISDPGRCCDHTPAPSYRCPPEMGSDASLHELDREAVLVLRWALGFVEIRVWALILAIVAAFLLFNNVPKIQHPPSPSMIECNGQRLAERGTCLISGEGVLSYDDLVQREQDSARDRAVIWTIFGTGAAAVAVIFLVPIRSRKASADRRGSSARARRAPRPLETFPVAEIMTPLPGLDDQ